MALDAKMRLKEAKKARYAKYDAKRKNLVDELEERERSFKKAKVEKAEKEKEMWLNDMSPEDIVRLIGSGAQLQELVGIARGIQGSGNPLG